MKRILLFTLIVIASVQISEAQVGINNTDPKAQLDISVGTTPSEMDGLLIPRLDEFPAGVGADQNGMLVFITGGGVPSKGFYYWDQAGPAWVPIIGAADTDWTIVGPDIERQSGDAYIGDDATTNNKLVISGVIEDWDNSAFLLDPNAESVVKEINYSAGSATDPSIHFDADTNSGLYRPAVDAIGITTNGSDKFRFTEQGQIEFYNSGSSVFLGQSAGANDDLMNRQNIAIGFSAMRDNVTGARNIAIGSGALFASTGGTANIAIGDDAMVANLSGDNNVGLGIQTLFSNTTGNNNTALGGTAMRDNTEGSNNTALGYRALYNNTTTSGNVAVGFDAGFENLGGTNNTYLGFNSGHLNMGDRNVFIGANSGHSELGSDKLYIENTNSVTPLIYGEFDTNILRTNGEFQVNDPTLTGYALPTTDGTIGQVLTTDGAGQMSFATPTPSSGTLDEAYDFGGAGLGRIIAADNGAVEIQDVGGLRVEGDIVAAENIVHDGDTDTTINFTPDRITMRAGGRNYVDINHVNQEIAFNEGGQDSDFRVESDDIQNMLFVNAGTNRVGIGTQNPGASLEIGTENTFDTSVAKAGQDGLFIRGSSPTGLNAVGGSISFGAAHPARTNSRRAAIASMQTGIDADNVGIAFYIHPGPVNTNPIEEAMRITHQKRLGINNTAPSATLDVIGTMQFEDGNQSAGYVLASDANGNATWTNPNTLVAADTDWITVGSDIERQAGDVYIGDDATTDNDLFISDRIIDWDNATFYVDPSATSSVDEINFSDGAASDPSIRFNGDTNTGFFQTEADAISFGASAVEYLKFSPKGQIEFLNTGGSVFIGQNAGNSDDYSNNQNVGIGSSALLNNVDGQYNVGIGQSALQANDTGDRNVGVGYFAGGGITSGQYNVALGSNALTATTEGESNIAIGYRALTANIDGDDNIAIGDSALPLATASDNIAIGSNSGQAMTSGDKNIGIGYRAQAAHSNGNSNIAIGYTSLDSMNSLTNNSNNVAIGDSSMTNLTEASDNVAIGHQALVGSGNGAPNFADQNVAIGSGAGQSNEGNGNIFLGYQAGQLAGVSDNKLFIDNSNTSTPLLYATFDTNEVGVNWDSTVALPNTLSVNGTASNTAGGAWVANSDSRLKKNIETIETGKALGKIAQLRGVKFEWDDHITGYDRPKGLQYGFIAQEIQKVFPENVTEDRQGYLQTAYGNYDPLFVQAFKEQQVQIESLKSENDKLKIELAKIKNLEARLTAIENNNSNFGNTNTIEFSEKKK